MSLDSYSAAAESAAQELIDAGHAIARKHGLTGFQAGWIFWKFATDWLSIEGGARLVKYEHALYPQYADYFRPRLPPFTMAWLRDRARKLLEDEDAKFTSPTVIAHWKKLAAGEKPWSFIEIAEID